MSGRGRPVRRRIVVLAGLALSAGCTANSDGPASTPPSPGSTVPTGTRCHTGWQVEAEPFAAGDRLHRLYAIDAASATDAWAVGESFTRQGPRAQFEQHPLVEHWNGISWSDESAGVPADQTAALYDIDVLSPDDAWAVGGYVGDRHAPLVEHWDGERWTPAAAPALTNAGPHFSQALVAVAGTAPDNVWALGSASPNGSTYVDPLLQWNGRTWTRVDGPRPAATASVSISTDVAVDAASGTPWVVGGRLQGTSEASTFDGARVETRDGRSWAAQPTPSGSFPLTDLALDGPDEAWAIRQPALQASPHDFAVGGRGPDSLMRFRGGHWTTALSTNGELNAVALGRPGEVWVAGREHQAPLLMQRDGHAWRSSTGSPPLSLPHGFFAMTVANDGSTLALGVSGPDRQPQLALRTVCPVRVSH